MVNWDTSQVQGEVLRNAANTITEKYWSNGSYNTGAQDGCSCKQWKLWRKKKNKKQQQKKTVGRPSIANSQ